MKDLTNLRKIAKAATPGPWEVCNVTEMGADGVTDLAHVLASELETEESVSAVAVSVIRHDATHIATFDPPTVLALIARLERAEAAVARVREQRDKWDREGSAYWISAEAAVIALDYALRELDGEQE